MTDTAYVAGGIVLGLAVIVLASPQPRGAPPVPKAPLGEYDVFVINLDGASQRLQHFRAQFFASDLSKTKSFIRVAAVDGRALAIEDIVSARALQEISQAEATGFRLRHYQLSRGAVGCYSSHVHVWRTALETDKRVSLVFEDDAQIHPDLGAYLATSTFPADFDIILLGFVCFKCHRDERAGLHRVKRFFGLHGYLISAKGIKKILASPRVFPIHQQIDAVLSDMAEAGELTVYATKRKFVEQNNEEFNTQIQIPIKQGEDPWAALKPHGASA